MTRWHVVQSTIYYLLAVVLVGCMLSTTGYGRKKSLRGRKSRIGNGGAGREKWLEEGMMEVEEKPGAEEGEGKKLGTGERGEYAVDRLDFEDFCVAM